MVISKSLILIFEYFESTFKLLLPFLYYTLSSPSSHVGTLVWSLWNSTKAQGTLLDLHGPLYGPQNGPSKANFRGPFLKKGPAGSLHGPKWAMFLNRSQDNGQTWIYSLVWGQSDIRFRRYNCFDSRWANWPPPHRLRVKIGRSTMEESNKSEISAMDI